jgi:hypothetical protein
MIYIVVEIRTACVNQSRVSSQVNSLNSSLVNRNVKLSALLRDEEHVIVVTLHGWAAISRAFPLDALSLDSACGLLSLLPHISRVVALGERDIPSGVSIIPLSPLS